jgi:hypothetical protein
MTGREPINRGRLRAQIQINALEDGSACIFCPTEVSRALYEHLTAAKIVSSLPRRAMFGRYPEDQLIVTSDRATVVAEVDNFIASLPEPCYERTVTSDGIP